jgi:RHS repeat-associated protein
MLAAVVVLLPGFSVGQTTQDFNSGFTPFQQYHGGDIDSINMATGSLNLHIPLISFPQKGTGLRLTFAINYNSTTIKRVFVGRPGTGYYQWSPVDTNYASVTVLDDQIFSTYVSEACEPNPPCGNGTQTHYHFYAVTGSDGAQHVMGYTSGSPTQLTGAVSLRSMDMTGFYLAVPDVTVWGGGNYTIYDESGNRYNYGYQDSSSSGMGVYGYTGGSRTDPNGNTISTSSQSGTYIDTIGRTIAAPPPVVSSTNNTDNSGCTGPYAIAKAVLWQVPGYNGQLYPIKFCYVNRAINVYDDGAAGQNGGPDGSIWGFTAIQSIVLPDAQTLSFSNGTPTAWTFEYYDPEGNGCNAYNYTGPCDFATLSKVTFPTGGSISYTYQMYGDSGGLHGGLQRAVKTRTVSDGITSNTWNYTYTYPPVTNTVTAPKLPYDAQGNDTVYSVAEAQAGYFDTAFVYQVDSYQGSYASGALLKSVSKAFTYYTNPYYQVNVGGQITPGLGSGKAGQLLNSETTTLGSKVSQATYAYDNGFSVVGLNGSVCCTFYYGVTTNATASDYGAAPNPGPVLRQTASTYQWQTNSNYLTANLLDRTSSVTTSGGGTQFAQTTYGYDENNGSPQGVFGNRTSVTRWLNNGTAPKSQTVFNSRGMPVTTIDPNLNSTTITYDSTGIFPSQIQQPDTSNGTVVHHIDSYVYDANTGLMSSHTDQNLLVTSYGYDASRRLTSVAYPDRGSENYSFSDTPPTPSFTFTKAINSGVTFSKVGKLDGLGRTIQTQLTSDPQGVVYTDTTYDAVGRVYTVSNPYRTGTDPTTSAGTTTYAYEAIGRKIKETYPDNSVLQTAYCGSSTLVADPTGKWRRSRTDGLGRLVEVDEPNAPGASVASTGCPGTGEPIWVTSYTIDALGNLTNVLQSGSHSRTFTYDSLSRLLCSSNPESATAACPAFGATSFPSGTVTYTHNPDSTLHTKTDARAITTTATYDQLHRELTRTYSNGDATITTTYDQAACLGLSTCGNIGQRTARTDAAGSEAWAYQVDAANHRNVHINQRATNSVMKTSTYYLDLAGNVTQAVYPTGRVVNYTYDSADRPSTAADGSNGITYTTDFQTAPSGCLTGKVCYTPQGTFYALSIGQSSSFTGLNLTHSYNSRLQPLEFKASSTGGNAIDITYGFVDPATLKNAGHVYSITNNLDTTRSQNLSYDQLNRITSALTTSTHATSPAHCWGETYQYDGVTNGAWGNLTQIAATANPAYTGCSQESGFTKTADGNNHLSGLSYDLSGNTQNDGVNSYTWDAESQLKTAAGVTYAYDGDGRRVSKVGSKLYWYGSGGEVLAETDSAGNTQNEYIFFGGKRIAMLPAGSTPIYYVEDMLGSSRVVTTNTGVVCYDADFYPFGGERAVTSTCPQNNYKFEGKERDAETGNDDFGARYYSNRFGRWLSADWSSVPVAVPYANLSSPQTLNLYAMVSDDPESFADLDGHDGVWVVDKATGQATLVIPVQFTGRSATPDVVSKIVDRDNKLDAGGSPVKIQVIATDKPFNGVLNTMDLSPGADKKFGSAGEGVNKLGGDKGHINTDNAKSNDAAAHDILHFAGIKDQYKEGPRDANGNRTSTPTTGYDNSNIMTSRSGTSLKPEQIQEAKVNKTTKQCTTDSGKTVCK